MIFWVDTETTGLDADLDELLEVGVRVTTDDMSNTLVEASYNIMPPFGLPKKLAPIVEQMHTKSGLLDELRSGNHHRVDEVQGWLCDLYDSVAGETPLPMAGSSVGFDRLFLRQNMPTFEAKFHYRNFDISAIKVMAERWAPDVVKSRPVPATRHRTLPDIADTIAEAKHYRSAFFERAVS